MKKQLIIILALTISILTNAQIDTTNQKAIPMSSTYQKAYKTGSVYYETGTTKPFTGVLYGKYDNGNYMTMQEYVNGIGNGKWINFDPMGRKVCEGTYKDNRVEGPVTFFYENGNIKSKGQYRHWKNPIGKWTYFDEKGNEVSSATYTR